MSPDMWVWWVLGGLVGWLALALLIGVIVGRSVRLADRRSLTSAALDAVPAAEVADHTFSLSGNRVSSPPAAPTRSKRGRVPLPPVGVALAALAVTLESIGFVLRLSGSTGETARLLSMDDPLSVPRMYVAALFAVAAVAALTGAGRIPGRRAWWAAVGFVGAGIGVVKAGGTVHAEATNWLVRTIGSTRAQVVSGVIAIAVVGTLWFLARKERRDRLRVLGSLVLYAGAAVGLSAVSASVSGARAAAVATFVEESGEALGAVVFLVAVLVGVAPRLVLPADWALRRSADAHTLDAADPVSEGRWGADPR